MWAYAAWASNPSERPASLNSLRMPSGRRQLTAETKNWERIAGVIGRLLRTVQQP